MFVQSAGSYAGPLLADEQRTQNHCLSLAQAQMAKFPSQRAFRLRVAVLPAQPQECSCDTLPLPPELPDHLKIVRDTPLKITNGNELFFPCFTDWLWFATRLVAQRYQLPHLGTHRIDEPLGGECSAISARECRRKAESRWLRTDHTRTSSACSTAAAGLVGAAAGRRLVRRRALDCARIWRSW